eukprot:TRINITY_DN3264_c0_g1_i5.p1 TRINITY_DN3264_c0_g1~~TRINITY_DN3264_c0_g1_i5.p1  ORF type:complete len:117 (-),score=10.19 TRINITY_DN3264_c0_g1_i5:91-441(-)
MSRQASIQSALNSGNNAGLIQAILNNPPFGCTDQAAKNADRQSVTTALSQFKKESDIETALSSLNDDQLDILMKYIYAGFEVSENSKELLLWHAAVLKKAGMGCIVRTISDKIDTL